MKDIQPSEAKDEFESIEEYAAYIKYVRPDLAKIWNEVWDESIIHDLVQTSQGKFREKDTTSTTQQMIDSIQGYAPQPAHIKVPVLSFVAFANPIPAEFYTEEQTHTMFEFMYQQWIPFQKEEMIQFKQHIPQAKVIEIPDGHHFCFMAQEELVYHEMRKFLQPAID